MTARDLKTHLRAEHIHDALLKLMRYGHVQRSGVHNKYCWEAIGIEPGDKRGKNGRPPGRPKGPPKVKLPRVIVGAEPREGSQEHRVWMWLQMQADPQQLADIAAAMGTTSPVMSTRLRRLSDKGCAAVVGMGHKARWVAADPDVEDEPRTFVAPAPTPETELERCWGWLPRRNATHESESMVQYAGETTSAAQVEPA
jgi:DNA-binding MarR family transcriptional regulator